MTKLAGEPRGASHGESRGEPLAAPASAAPATASNGGAGLDRRSQTLLEFPLVRARLADETGFPPGRRLAEALEPSTDRVIVARGLEETSQTRSFVAEHPGSGIGGSKDILPWVERAARAGRLEPRHFLDIAETLEAASRLGEAISGDRRPLLRDLAREIHPLPSLRNTLNPQLRPDGRDGRHRIAAPGRTPSCGSDRLRPAAHAARPARPLERVLERSPGADRHSTRRAIRDPVSYTHLTLP